MISLLSYIILLYLQPINKLKLFLLNGSVEYTEKQIMIVNETIENFNDLLVSYKLLYFQMQPTHIFMECYNMDFYLM